MNLKRLGAVITRHAVFIAGLTALMVLVTAIFSFRQADNYRASSLVEVQPPVSEDGSVSLQGTLTARERAVTIAKLAGTDEVVERAREAVPAGSVAASCSAAQQGQSEFIDVTCTSTDSAAVAAAADARAVALQDYLEEQRQARVDELDRLYQLQIRTLRRQGVTPGDFPPPPIFPSYREVEVRESASVPDAPFEPKPLRAIAIALVIGLAINTALAFLLEYLQDRAHGIDDVERGLGEPILAAIPVIRARPEAGSTRDRPTRDRTTREKQARGRALMRSARGGRTREPQESRDPRDPT